MGANNVAKKNGQLLNSPRPTMIQETEYNTRAVLITHLLEDEVKQNFLNMAKTEHTHPLRAVQSTHF